MKQVTIYCDGACSGNPGPGGWAALLMTTLRNKPVEKLIDGGAAHTTNNRMELSAAIGGLRALKEKCEVCVFTDSRYVIQGITEWIEGWKSRGWKNSANKPVVNQDLWELLDIEVSRHTVDWKWVKGHSGHPLNERVDEAAQLQSMKWANR